MSHAPDLKSKASIHKNLAKAHEIMCQVESLETHMKLYHFDRLIKEASQALKLGMGKMNDDWVRELVERGKEWDLLLENLLTNQTSHDKTDILAAIFFKANKENPENAVFL